MMVTAIRRLSRRSSIELDIEFDVRFYFHSIQSRKPVESIEIAGRVQAAIIFWITPIFLHFSPQPEFRRRNEAKVP